MLGWHIIVTTQPPENLDSYLDDRYDPKLAEWVVGLGGIDWLDKLVDSGKAKKITPCLAIRYRAKISDIVPLIRAGSVLPPANSPLVIGIDEGEEYIHPSGWIDEIKLYEENIIGCAPDSIITIDAWDQS